ncbi:Secretion-regulating guanine nucleotide exchange factor [Smittium mucronatum]|uniref:Secretion-regulating guanine nucleotide exchange factor n=1 Tax=Smittium mucronatum TaxID=133383 RepID=A0A1R0GUC9_9FUNG|nr:Secretion-regulating guanine nucleotide exchange factor [Smittium mucronatum]
MDAVSPKSRPEILNCQLVPTIWRVSSIGSNSGGQLGLGNDIDQYSPEPALFRADSSQNSNAIYVPSCIADLANSSPPIIVGGGNHSVLYWKGLPLLFGCGSNADGELPFELLSNISRVQSNVWSPLNIPSEDQIIDAKLVSSNSLCNECDPNQTKVKVCQVSLGWNHSLLLSTSGRVYSCGNNKFGQLGYNNVSKNAEFSLVFIDQNLKTPLKNVSRISSGLRHNLALTADNLLFGWGSNSHNQIGVPNNSTLGKKISKFIDCPTSIPISGKIVSISCGRHHSAWISTSFHSNNLRYVSGDVSKDESCHELCDPGISLGVLNNSNSESGNQIRSKFKINSESNNLSIGNSCLPMLGIAGKSKVKSQIDLLSNGVINQVQYTNYPLNDLIPLKGYSPHENIYLCSSWDCLFILIKVPKSDIFNVYGYGSNMFGLLGDSNLSTESSVLDSSSISNLDGCKINSLSSPKPLISDINTLACGSYHAVSLSCIASPAVSCWGWNEHGNCNSKPCQSVWPPNAIEIKDDLVHEIFSIGAGYGNTFVVYKA